MFSKRSRGQDPSELPADKRLRTNVGELFLSGAISGERAASLYADAAAAGARHVSDMHRGAASSSGRRSGHAFRDLTRRLTRRLQWPSLYNAEVRVWDRRLSMESKAWLPLLLPHEIVAKLCRFSDMAHLLAQGGMEPASRDHLRAAARELGVADALGLGLWLDGVPYNWDRSESLETAVLNCPGLLGKFQNMRIPIAAIPSNCVLKGATWDDILEIVVWSLKALALDRSPSMRHDDSAWLPSDRHRAKEGGRVIGVPAVLLEVRGDWKMMKDIFRFPAWNEKKGCCWLCEVGPDGIRDCSSDAPWRTQRLSHWQFLARSLARGVQPSPLMSAPCIRTSCYKIDWLHCADQGVGADFLGNMFSLLLSKMPGATVKQRCASLFKEILAYYRDHPAVDSRLDSLTLGMIRRPKKAPKLNCKGAEARHLIPFAKLAAHRLLSDAVPVERTAKQCADHLAACYEALGSGCLFQADILSENCRRFCLLYVALEALVNRDKLWSVKPKLHMFQELCEMSQGARPALTWTYRDEDFGVSLARLAKRRGGTLSATSGARTVVHKFVAMHAVPALRGQ